MKVLNAEDNAFKHHHIKCVLEDCGKVDIDWVTTLPDAVERIKEAQDNGEPFDLVITDMYYPDTRIGCKGEVMAGELLIRKLNDMDIKVPIIMCSSVNYKIPEIFGCVHYSENSEWEYELKKLIKKLM